jgi:hypothetical protein
MKKTAKIPEKMESIRVRISADPQVKFSFGYFDIYPDVYADVYHYVSKRERRDLTLLAQLAIEEFGYIDTICEIKQTDFVRVQSELNEKYAIECRNLQEIIVNPEEFIKNAMEE